jgi:hypothetical protein
MSPIAYPSIQIVHYHGDGDKHDDKQCNDTGLATIHHVPAENFARAVYDRDHEHSINHSLGYRKQETTADLQACVA